MKTYFTFLQRNKLFTFVNVIGLSISLMFLLLITHMVTRQLTVDKDMKDADRTYVLANEIWAGGHILLGDKLQSRYPEIEDWCAVSGYYEQFVRTNDQPVNIQMMFVRENFFQFFNFHLLEGNPETLLANENNIVLTRSCAIKLFGTEHALGKTLIEQAFGDRRCTVSGIIEDIDNSIFPSNIEAFSLHKNVRYVHWSASEENTQLGNAASCIFFLRFHPNVNPNDKADDIARFFKEFFWIYQYDSVKEVLFIPIHEFYFSDTLAAGAILNQYSLKVVLIFLTIGVLILFMAIFIQLYQHEHCPDQLPGKGNGYPTPVRFLQEKHLLAHDCRIVPADHAGLCDWFSTGQGSRTYSHGTASYTT